MRRLALAAVLLLAVVAPALGDDAARKHAIDTRISSLQGRLSAQRHREAELRTEVAGYTARIRALEQQVGDVSLRLETLDADLALHQKRLAALNALFELQNSQARFLDRQYGLAARTLARRLVEIYSTPQPSTIEVLLGAENLQDAIDQVQELNAIGRNDEEVANAVASSKALAHAARDRTKKLRTGVQAETAAVAARAQQARDVRTALVGAQGDLSAQRRTRLVALSELSVSERAEASEIDALQASSNAIAARIREAQAARSGGGATDTTPSSAGLIWPVSGPITSPFGWRWGRMHQGIDIGVPYGTPIHAAAAGTVIYCGWEEGYGNFVVIDHGGDLATAYGHQSQIAVSCGEHVEQGQVIGYVGCTGHCTGPHLHFEVRINGNPVDPLGYL
jgi:murein DD-endopeptidase MepM/ murein hydrolase activator NlpD